MYPPRLLGERALRRTGAWAAVGAAAVAAAQLLLACGGGGGETQESGATTAQSSAPTTAITPIATAPDGTYKGRTDQGLPVTLRLQDRTVRSAAFRVKGSGGSCGIEAKLQALNSRVRADGTFKSKPILQRIGGKFKGDRTITVSGRFIKPTTVKGTIRYRSKVRIPGTPGGEPWFTAPGGGTVVNPGTPSITVLCPLKTVGFTAVH